MNTYVPRVRSRLALLLLLLLTVLLLTVFPLLILLFLAESLLSSRCSHAVGHLDILSSSCRGVFDANICHDRVHGGLHDRRVLCGWSTRSIEFNALVHLALESFTKLGCWRFGEVVNP